MHQLSKVKTTSLIVRKKDRSGNDLLPTTAACSIHRSTRLKRTNPSLKATAESLVNLNEAALLCNVANVIPQVREVNGKDDLAEQIALEHRRFVLAAAAELKKLTAKDERSERAPKPVHRNIMPPAAAAPLRPRVNDRPRLAANDQHASRRTYAVGSTVAQPRSHRRVAVLDGGAISHELNAMLRHHMADDASHSLKESKAFIRLVHALHR